jgi:uncharacterized protein YjbI with pentapeptide repeats
MIRKHAFMRVRRIQELAYMRLPKTAALTSALMFALAAPSLAECKNPPAAGVDWSNCSKKLLMLGGADLKEATLVDANLTSTDFSNARLTGSNLDRADITYASFKQADLTGASMLKTSGNRTVFAGATLDKANMDAIELFRADFSGASLAGANLSRASMPRTMFDNANLAGADLQKSDMIRSSFNGADLRGVNMTFAILARSSFDGAQLEGSDWTNTYLYRTRLQGVDLSGVTGLTDGQVALACGDDDTRLPEGLSRPERWPCMPRRTTERKHRASAAMSAQVPHVSLAEPLPSQVCIGKDVDDNATAAVESLHRRNISDGGKRTGQRALLGRAGGPRVIPLDRFHVPRKLARQIRKGTFAVTVDQDFEAVIAACAGAQGSAGEDAVVERPSTWINTRISALYAQLHAMGCCHSIEVRDPHRRPACRRFVWCAHWRGFLWRKHVLCPPRRLKGCAGSPGGAAQGRRLQAARHPVRYRSPEDVRVHRGQPRGVSRNAGTCDRLECRLHGVFTR